MKKLLSVTLVVLLIGSVFSCSAIDTRTEKGTATGAVIGAVAGAALGQAIGRDTKSTLWGAAIGGIVGGVAGHEIGYYMDQQERRLDSIAAQSRSQAMSVDRSQDVLTATFRSDLLFDHDSAILKPGAYTEIDRVSRVLTDFPETVIRVDGHTDSTGPEEYNMRLSKRRADAVKNALIQRGVHPGRIETLGLGESMPVSSSNAANRRVEVIIIPVRG